MTHVWIDKTLFAPVFDDNPGANVAALRLVKHSATRAPSLTSR